MAVLWMKAVSLQGKASKGQHRSGEISCHMERANQSQDMFKPATSLQFAKVFASD